MCKRFLTLMLALVMAVSLLPTAAFAAASSVTEPLADENTSDGSPPFDDTQPSERGTADEGSDNTDGESAPAKTSRWTAPALTGTGAEKAYIDSITPDKSDPQERHGGRICKPRLVR